MTSRGQVNFLLKRSSARRSLVISVGLDAKVEVAAPFSMPEKDINDFIKVKTDWLFDKIGEAQRHCKTIQRKSYSNGERFLFLGRKYPLKVIERKIKRAHVSFFDQILHVTLPVGLEGQEAEEEIRKKLFQWYRKQAEEVLGGRIFHFSKQVGAEPKTIAVRAHRRVWGNCDFNTKTIHLNWQIILAPMSVIDYIVVHELCHLLVPNHSKKFWKTVENVLPDYKDRKRWLRDNWADMVLPEVGGDDDIGMPSCA